MSKSAVALGYVSENDIWRMRDGAAAIFVPEDPLGERRTGSIFEIVRSGLRVVDLPYLASVYGGAVQSDRHEEEIRPRSGQHLVRVALTGPAVDRVVRGSLLLTAQRESFAAAAWRRVLQVLVRESGA